MRSPDPPTMRSQLSTMLLARIALNSQLRIVYPFLPAISRGLGVPLETASLLLTARGLVTMLSPLLGLLADRAGRRMAMLVGLTALAAGAALVTWAPTFGWALTAFALLGLAKASYDPAMQAYVSDTVPYSRRGRVLAVLEISWSAAWLLGVPAAGFLIAAFGWRSPFAVISVAGVAGLIATFRTVREPQRGPGGAGAGRPGGSGLASLKAALRSPAVWTLILALAVNCLQVAANENVFIVYGAWLEERFGLSVTALGLASIVIAGAEFLGESWSAGIVDRLGKRRAVAAGLLASVLAYVALPYTAVSLVGALAGVCLIFLTFEFSIVCALPLVSELAPTARGITLAANLAAAALGRVVASLTGPRLWAAGGLPYNAMTSAAIAGLAVLLLWFGVQERAGSPSEPDQLEHPSLE